MPAKSFEITAHMSKSISSHLKVNKMESFHRWFCSLVACDYKMGGSIPCQEKAALLIR